MISCPVCKTVNPDQSATCQQCGAPLTAPPPQGAPLPYPYSPQPQPQYFQSGPPAFIPSAQPPQPPLYFRQKRPFTWTDVATVLGFVSSIMGFFWASVVLLPLGLVASMFGFRGVKTLGLAVAGMVIYAIGLLFKLMIILRQAALLPDWFTSGIW